MLWSTSLGQALSDDDDLVEAADSWSTSLARVACVSSQGRLARVAGANTRQEQLGGQFCWVSWALLP
jgi:hypothetical protein